MFVEIRVPDVYGHHELLNAACEPFKAMPGRLVVSEVALTLTPHWKFCLTRGDGKLPHWVLPFEDRMQSPAALLKVVQDRLAAMLAA